MENDEFELHQMIGDAPLPSCASLGFQPVDQIDEVEKSAAHASSNAGSCDGDRQMRLAGSHAADEDDIALLR